MLKVLGSNPSVYNNCILLKKLYIFFIFCKNLFFTTKNCHLSNQFWLYQLGVRSEYFQRYETWKREILIWVTLYHRVRNLLILREIDFILMKSINYQGFDISNQIWFHVKSDWHRNSHCIVFIELEYCQAKPSFRKMYFRPYFIRMTKDVWRCWKFNKGISYSKVRPVVGLDFSKEKKINFRKGYQSWNFESFCIFNAFLKGPFWPQVT